MALQTADGTSDRIAVAANATIDDLTAFTTLQWFYMTAFTSGRRLWSKNGKDLAMGFTATPNSMFFQVNRATVNALADSNANIYSNDTWACVATTYDETDGPRIFIGSLTAALAEAGYVSSPTVGSGATSADNTETLKVLNRTTLVGAPAGRVGEFLFWNRRLTLGELRTHQWRPHASSGLVVWHKYNEGTGTQRDYSGNKNTGTVTGATALTTHVPLVPSFGFDVKNIRRGAAVTTFTKTASLDAAIRTQQTQTASLTAAIQARQSVTSNLDAVIRAAQAVTGIIDAALRQNRTASAQADAAIRANQALAASIDAYIQTGSTVTTSVDAAIRRALNVAAALDAAIRANMSVAASLDAAIQAGATLTAAIDAAIQVGSVVLTSIDAAILRTMTASVALDAAIMRALTMSAAIDAYISDGAPPIPPATRFTVGARREFIVPPKSRFTVH